MTTNKTSIIEEIIAHPNLYLGEKSITKLYYYIFGYTSACIEMVHDTTLANKTSDFRQYVVQKYSVKKTLQWGDILLEASGRNETTAFERFKNDWNEFCDLTDERNATQ